MNSTEVSSLAAHNTWLAAVRPIIAFHDASQFLTNAMPRTAAGRALVR
jgi:hypothetical protein